MDEAGELLDRLTGPGFREGDGLCDLGSNLRFDTGQVVGMDHVIGLEPGSKPRYRIALPPSLDLALVAVELSVEHRMGTQPVGPAFEEIWLPSLAHLMDRAPRRRLDRHDIHAVDSLRADLIAGGLALDVRFRLRECQRRPHRIKVVL